MRHSNRLLYIGRSNTTYFFEFSPDRETVDNVTRPVVFEDLTQGIKSKLVPIVGDSSGTDESEDDDAYLKRIQPR